MKKCVIALIVLSTLPIAHAAPVSSCIQSLEESITSAFEAGLPSNVKGQFTVNFESDLQEETNVTIIDGRDEVAGVATLKFKSIEKCEVREIIFL